MATKERSLDLFWLLAQIDKQNYDVWDTLTEEQRKEFSPYMTMRWMMGCNDPAQLVSLGEIANACIFEFSDKPDLLLKILTACSMNGVKRYSWVTPKGSSSKAESAVTALIAEAYKLPLRKVPGIRNLLSDDDIIELAEAYGWQKAEITDLKKELKSK